jgi:ribonucleoside-diphosphate reductase alpha chain
MSLQYGVPLEVLVNKFSHTRFEPMGYTTNPDVRIAKSVVDYIFRWLGITFLAGYREAHHGLLESEDKGESESKGEPASTGDKSSQASSSHGANGSAGNNGSAKPTAEQRSSSGASASSHSPSDNGSGFDAGLLHRAGVAMQVDRNGNPGVLSEQFAQFQSDAPSCDNCGAITVRNGNCYLCHNCGNSMGCS